MMAIIKIGILATVLLTLLLGCKQEQVANKPVSEAVQSEGKTSMPDSGLPKIPSVKDIKSEQEEKYAQKLTQMRQVDPIQEAKANIAANRLILKAVQTRAVSIPGIDSKEYAIVQAKCRLEFLEGMGDVIYGQNHMQYRLALEKQAAAYNKAMFAACQ